ncbi:uncharacterized protein [Dermacentor albipictus]
MGEHDSFVSLLASQIVKVPVGQSSAQPAGAGFSSIVPSPVVASSQDASSNLTSRVRTAVDHLGDPVVTALQNASLWLNRTSQLHLNKSHHHPVHHEHQYQQGGQANHAHLHAVNNHHELQHLHGAQANRHSAHEPTHKVDPAHVHLNPQAIPNQAVPVTLVSAPVLVPAVHAVTLPLMNLSAVVLAGVDVPSPDFSIPGQHNATSPVATAAEPVTATSQSTSAPAASVLVGRTGALTIAPSTGTPDTLVSDVSSPPKGSDIIATSTRPENLDDATGTSGTPTSIIHHTARPDYSGLPLKIHSRALSNARGTDTPYRAALD